LIWRLCEEDVTGKDADGLDMSFTGASKVLDWLKKNAS
jgi:hypothetical protein